MLTVTRPALGLEGPPASMGLAPLPEPPTVATTDSASDMPGSTRMSSSSRRAIASVASGLLPTGNSTSTRIWLGGMSSGKSSTPALKR